MKKSNYVAPAISESSSRVRSNILAGSGSASLNVTGEDIGFANAAERKNVSSLD